MIIIAGDKNMAPTPEIPTPEQAGFFIRFWQEILGGIILILVGWYSRLKGRAEPIYLDEEDIEQRMKICKQDIIITLNKMLDERDEKLLQHIRDIMK